jgi:hypothetical protein
MSTGDIRLSILESEARCRVPDPGLRGESSVESPNPDYLKIHVAFAKVLYLSEVTEYVRNVEKDAGDKGTALKWGNGFRVQLLV